MILRVYAIRGVDCSRYFTFKLIVIFVYEGFNYLWPPLMKKKNKKLLEDLLRVSNEPPVNDYFWLKAVQTSQIHVKPLNNFKMYPEVSLFVIF